MLPEFDEDYIPLALILLLIIVWVSAVLRQNGTIEAAGSIMEFGIGAIAGYMAKSKAS